MRRREIFLLALVAGSSAMGCAAASVAGRAPANATAVPPTVAPMATNVPTATVIPPPATPTAAPTLVPTAADPPASPTLVPAPSPTRDVGRPYGPPRDPGPLDWAHPGRYVGAGFDPSALGTFRSTQPLATTYYFYWHDLTDPVRAQRIKTAWTQHPPNPEAYTFASPVLHRRQFEDMQAAGLDFVLPVYWGEPGHPGRMFNPTAPHFWSTEGIPPMVAALDAMAAAGHPFKLGMFYDTTILANADLRTANGKAYFYVNVRDFYSRIPPRHWAAIDQKPIVWLYDTAWVSGFDQSTFDDLAARFQADFGGLKPYVARESQWYRARGPNPAPILHTDNIYGWSAAPSGFNPDPKLGVAEVGPGFNNSGFCRGGAAQNCFDVSRENGAYYERNLSAALASGRKILAIETWNEFSEGSNIAETVEDGRKYLEITRRYADKFHVQGGP